MNKTLLTFIVFSTQIASAEILYDCTAPRPEHAGFHNMVVFGRPDDTLYAHHLPLFKGELNGTAGHVLMHVYQAMWNIGLDTAAAEKYKKTFDENKTPSKPFPFFSLSPKGNRFTVPEMICDEAFSRKAKVVVGHVEGNPDFPAPLSIFGKDENGQEHPTLADVTRIGKTVFARRFDGTAKEKLSYFIFGTSKQLYMAHFLTDDENSFDQILAIESESDELKDLVLSAASPLFTIANSPALVLIEDFSSQRSPNNKYKISKESGVKIKVESPSLPSGSAELTVIQEIYFNNNADLWVRE